MRLRSVLVALFVSLLGFASAQLPRATRDLITRSTVMLLPTGKDGKLDGSLGSGSIISPLGYILTNYHVVGDPDTRELSEWIQVRVIRFVDQEPEFRYWGQVVKADPNLDLAIVKIVQDTQEKPVGPLNLPYVELGDSGSLIIGDPIAVFGYQGTGGMTLSFSNGSVAGFTGESRDGSGRQWIKHDAQTGPGNSGGGVYDETGALIGVHTVGVAGNNNSRTAFFRPIALAWGLITPNVPRFVVHGQGQGSGSTPSGGGSQGTPQTAGSTPGWPPALAVGQNWNLEFRGSPNAGAWAVALTGKDSDGDTTGTASSGGQNRKSSMYYDSDNDRVWLEVIQSDGSSLGCVISPADIASAPWAGRAYTFKAGSTTGDRIGDCTFGLRQSGSTGTSAASLGWPPRLSVGQTWIVTFQATGQNAAWIVPLTEKDNQGDPAGTATSGSRTRSAFAYYYAKNDRALFDLYDTDKTSISCAVGPDDARGAVWNGRAYAYAAGATSGELIGTCTASLR